MPRIRREIQLYELISLTVLVIQFISIDSDTLVSALNFLILSSKEGTSHCHLLSSRERQEITVHAELRSLADQASPCD